MDEGRYTEHRVRVKEGSKIISYGDVAKVVFGQVGGFVVDLSSCFLCIGTIIAYLMFILEQLCQVFSEMITPVPWIRYPLCVTIVVFLVWIIPVLNGRSISYLSMMPLVAIMASGFIIMFFLGEKAAEGEHYLVIKQFDYQGIPFFFGIAFFLYEGNP